MVEAETGRPRRIDEVMMTPLAAQLLGVHVGDVIHYGIYNFAEQNEPGFGTAKVPPHRRVDATLVGLVQVSNAIVEDDIDRYPTFVFFTPAMGRAIVADGGQGNEGAVSYYLQLDRGNRGVAAVEREFAAVSPPGNTYGFHSTAGGRGQGGPHPQAAGHRPVGLRRRGPVGRPAHRRATHLPPAGR